LFFGDFLSVNKFIERKENERKMKVEKVRYLEERKRRIKPLQLSLK
jgi:hypothetical protein